MGRFVSLICGVCVGATFLLGCGGKQEGIDASELRLAFQPAHSALRDSAERAAEALEAGEMKDAASMLARLRQAEGLTLRQQDAIRKLQGQIRKRTSRRGAGVEDAAREELH